MTEETREEKQTRHPQDLHNWVACTFVSERSQLTRCYLRGVVGNADPQSLKAKLISTSPLAAIERVTVTTTRDQKEYTIVTTASGTRYRLRLAANTPVTGATLAEYCTQKGVTYAAMRKEAQ